MRPFIHKMSVQATIHTKKFNCNLRKTWEDKVLEMPSLAPTSVLAGLRENLDLSQIGMKNMPVSLWPILCHSLSGLVVCSEIIYQGVVCFCSAVHSISLSLLQYTSHLSDMPFRWCMDIVRGHWKAPVLRVSLIVGQLVIQQTHLWETISRCRYHCSVYGTLPRHLFFSIKTEMDESGEQN